MRLVSLDESCPVLVTDAEVEAAIEASKDYMRRTHPGLRMPPMEELRRVWRQGLEAAARVRAA